VPSLQLAWDFIRLAREQLAEWRRSGKEAVYRMACEKIWAAVAQAVVQISRRPITHHKEYQDAVQEIYRQTGRREFLEGFILGDKIHGGGFYHGKFKDRIDEYVEQISNWLRLAGSLSARE